MPNAARRALPAMSIRCGRKLFPGTVRFFLSSDLNERASLVACGRIVSTVGTSSWSEMTSPKLDRMVEAVRSNTVSIESWQNRIFSRHARPRSQTPLTADQVCKAIDYFLANMSQQGWPYDDRRAACAVPIWDALGGEIRHCGQFACGGPRQPLRTRGNPRR
jgi:hypothetical protein